MHESEIKSYGKNEKYLYKSDLKKSKKHSLMKALIVGFDTEYDSKTNELYSIQLSIKGHKYFFDYRDKKLDFDKLYKHTIDICKEHNINYGEDHVSSFIYSAFFSIAEGQHLAYNKSEIEIIEYGQGNYDFCYSPNTGQTMRILDLQVWFRGSSLAKVAKKFGYKKLDNRTDKFDITKVTRETVDIPEFREYAIHDPYLTENILRDLRKEFWNLWEIDILRMRTPAASSMHLFKRDYLKENIEMKNTKIRRLSLLCSWGGNNQCFKRGDYNFSGTKKLFYEYDAVSMYPNACLQLKKLPRQEDWKLCRNLKAFTDPVNIGGICKIGFEFPDEIDYPCLPVFYEGKLIYPLKAKECYCTLEEVKLALEMDCKIKFFHGFIYEDGITDLPDYLKMLLEKKSDMTKTGDLIRRTLYKLMMNSIIGKFTQKVNKYNINDFKIWAEGLEVPIYTLMNTHNVDKSIARHLLIQAKNEGEITLKEFGKYLTNYELFVKDFGEPVRKSLSLGSGYYPEWNTLILGYARATLARAFWEKGAYVGTTDSFITDQDPADGYIEKHNKKTGELMKIGYFDCNGIRFEFERTGKRLVSVRTRLYALFDEKNEIGHMAYHGISSFKTAKEFLGAPDWTKPYRKYNAKHMIKIRESLRRNKPLASTEIIEKKVSWGWDNKRRLVGLSDRIKELEEECKKYIDDELEFMNYLVKNADKSYLVTFFDEEKNHTSGYRIPSQFPPFFKEMGLTGERGRDRVDKAIQKKKGTLYKRLVEHAKERLTRRREFNREPSFEFMALQQSIEELKNNYKCNYMEDSKPFKELL
ncbi:MAG: DNA polymerase [Candidatus Woesearchaeota archaeon]